MNVLRTHGWRIALAASAVAMLNGGRMHPESDGSDPLREELATMTADPDWVTGHALVVAATVLLVLGLRLTLRQEQWPTRVRRVIGMTSVVLAAYVIETVFHLAAVVDSAELASGGHAPVAMTHIWLAAVLYPASGLAIAYLADTLGRGWSRRRRVLAYVGVVAGLLHAASVPLTLVFPSAELSPVFAGAGVLIALWTVGLAVMPAPSLPTVPGMARSAVSTR
jgi:hypothetical protein